MNYIDKIYTVKFDEPFVATYANFAVFSEFYDFICLYSLDNTHWTYYTNGTDPEDSPIVWRAGQTVPVSNCPVNMYLKFLTADESTPPEDGIIQIRY